MKSLMVADRAIVNVPPRFGVLGAGVGVGWAAADAGVGAAPAAGLPAGVGVAEGWVPAGAQA
ncbi:MAG: hypothetical protein ACYC1C_02580 [Chloroflexota bacterium]